MTTLFLAYLMTIPGHGTFMCERMSQQTCGVNLMSCVRAETPTQEPTYFFYCVKNVKMEKVK